jgi:rod shape-determining protein MreD
MVIIIAIPIFIGITILQSAIISRIPLIQGTADIILLTMIGWASQERVRSAWQWCIIGGLIASIASGLPIGTLMIGYSISVGFTLIIRQRVWKLPILAMFVATIFGTLVTHGVTIISRWITGAGVFIIDGFNLITLPSLILNIFLALPVYIILRDLSRWLYPAEIEI